MAKTGEEEIKVPVISGTAKLNADDDTAGFQVDSADSYALKYVKNRTVHSILSAPTTDAVSVPGTTSQASGVVLAKTVKFDATDGHDVAVGTSTGTIEIPAGSVVVDIQVQTTVLWDAGTSTTLLVGDDDDPNGWFTATNLQATDQLVGEIFSALHGDLWGGNNGAYLVAATGRRGRVTAGVDSGNYYGAASEVVATVVTVGTVPTVGTTYLTVFYAAPTQIAATYVAT